MGQLILVRHGQASFGADDYDVLSETGWEQGRALGTWLRESGVRPTSLVRGSLRRHRETLEALTETAGWGDLAVAEDAGWDEFDHVSLVAADAEAPTPTTDRRAFQKVFGSEIFDYLPTNSAAASPFRLLSTKSARKPAKGAIFCSLLAASSAAIQPVPADVIAWR